MEAARALALYRRGLRAARVIRIVGDIPTGNRSAQLLREAYTFYAPARWDATRGDLVARAEACVNVLEKLAMQPPHILRLFFRQQPVGQQVQAAPVVRPADDRPA